MNNASTIAALEKEGAVLQPGQLYMANESRFNAAFFSEPLTTFSVGWRETNDLEGLLDFIAPPVQVGRRFEYKTALNAEAFLSETDDLRSIGSDFKQVDYKGSSVNDKTANKGLVMRVDMDAVAGIPNWRELYTSRLLTRLLRNELRRAVTALVNGAANANKTWDTSAGKDPDQDILGEMLTGADEVGLRCNRVLFGDVAWNKRLISHRAQASAGGFASSALTTDQLAGFLGVDGVRISRERYQSSATAKSKVVPDNVVLFYGQMNPTPDDPTSLKRFWSATDGGTKYRVYEQQVNAKLVDLTVEHYSTIAVTSSIGLRKITVL